MTGAIPPVPTPLRNVHKNNSAYLLVKENVLTQYYFFYIFSLYCRVVRNIYATQLAKHCLLVAAAAAAAVVVVVVVVVVVGAVVVMVVVVVAAAAMVLVVMWTYSVHV